MNKSYVFSIVDDDEISQFALAKMIQVQKGIEQILTFSDGEEILNYLLDHLGSPDSIPDVILLDLNMPVMDGWQFLEEFLKLKDQIEKKVFVFIVTSSVDEVDIKRAKGMPDIAGYLIKPIAPEHVDLLVDMLKDNEAKAKR